jgi:hypothetical protein
MLRIAVRSLGLVGGVDNVVTERDNAYLKSPSRFTQNARGLHRELDAEAIVHLPTRAAISNSSSR